MDRIVKVGFTGSRHGLTGHQVLTIVPMLRRFSREEAEFHHGQCVGADEQAARLARDMGYRIVAHPPRNPTLRSTVEWDEAWPPEDYLVRNRAIVDEVDILIAAPATADSVLRSGTQATVRYCERRWPEKLLVIVNPAP